MKNLGSLIILSVLILACGPSKVDQAAELITKEGLMSHIEVLSSDEFEGRGTGTVGEQMSVDYLIDELQKIGATSGVEDGSFVQAFPLLGQTTSNFTLNIRKNSRNVISPTYFDDFVAWPANESERVNIQNAEFIYVGYGIQAPEENWDDYKGVDVEGKILVFKNSDPAYDEDLFGGITRLYYGRHTYKYEIAKKLGALGAFIIHTDETAGYGWSVVSNSWSRERFYVKAADKGSTEVNGWFTQSTSEELFNEAGLNLEEMLAAADSPDFQPVPLTNVRLNLSLDAEYREINAQNVIGKIEGSDPELKDEFLILTAHFDHLGITTSIDGDAINNGASDNAAGVSAVLELMQAYKSIQPELKRSVIALLVSAEEVGLLGSQYWAENPTEHPGKISANINLDGMNVYGETNDIVIVGYGRSSVSDLVVEEANKTGREVKADSNPDQGYFYRSDHFNMAKVGIPAIFPTPGSDFVNKPEGYSTQIDSVSAANYHSVRDEINEWWDLSGAEIDSRLFFRVGEKILNAPEKQTWKAGDEFEATRIEMINDLN